MTTFSRFLSLRVILILFGISATFAQSNFRFPATTNEIEQIPVAIQGGGVAAGTYYVPPALRVFDIIKMASPDNKPDLRTINCRKVITSFNNTKDTLDLLRYLSLGDYTQNPFVTAGMTVKLDYLVDYVFVDGEVQGSVMKRVPIAPGETARELLSLYTFTGSADSSNILLYRDGEGTARYSLEKLSGVMLEDRDFLSVLPKADMPRHAKVRVSGEAASPGVYPVILGKTTLKEIIDQAGGASSKGDIGRAYLIRKAKVQKNPSAAFLSGQNNVRPEVTGGFKYLTSSRDYAVIPVTDSAALLEDGDEIIIPPVEHRVYVSGCVKKPGAYTYIEGKDTEYYIEIAGGYTRPADKPNVKVITPFTDDAFYISEPRHLSAGDIVMVPEAQEDKWIKRWSPVISAAASVISSVSIIVGLTGIAK